MGRSYILCLQKNQFCHLSFAAVSKIYSLQVRTCQFIYCHLINGVHLYANLTSSRCTNKMFPLQKDISTHRECPKYPQAPDIHWFIIRVSAYVVFRQSGEIFLWHCLLQDLASSFTDIIISMKTFSLVCADFLCVTHAFFIPPNIHSRFLSGHSTTNYHIIFALVMNFLCSKANFSTILCDNHFHFNWHNMKNTIILNDIGCQ